MSLPLGVVADLSVVRTRLEIYLASPVWIGTNIRLRCSKKAAWAPAYARSTPLIIEALVPASALNAGASPMAPRSESRLENDGGKISRQTLIYLDGLATQVFAGDGRRDARAECDAM